MFESIRQHPFAVEAFFRRSLVLTYALPAEALQPLVGPGLTLDTYDERWGFLAIALVQTQGLRPKGMPRWLGRDFFLSGYRIFTRFSRPGQPSLRGLRILHSITDRSSMVRFGNLFTRYRYSLAKVDIDASDTAIEVRVRTPDGFADLHVEADLRAAPSLPEGSPFRSMEDARKFAGPLPFTFSYDEAAGKMVVVKGLRQAWDPRPVPVKVHEASFLEHAPYAEAAPRLANAFYVERIPYAWKPGSLESLS